MTKLSSYQKLKLENLNLRRSINELVNNPKSIKSMEITTAFKVNYNFEKFIMFGNDSIDGKGLFQMIAVAD